MYQRDENDTWNAVKHEPNEKRTIELPNGYNDHTVRCYAAPIKEPRGNVILLRVAEPGREHLIRWCHRETYDAAMAQSR